MVEYAVNLKKFSYREMCEKRELFNELIVRCEKLVELTVYVKSLNMEDMSKL